jgi:polysaccharide chain length determinant protein (PEP-CTERM system associated)
MPGEGENYFTRLEMARKELAEAELAQREVMRRRDELKRQISGEEPVLGMVDSAPAAGGLSSQYDGRIESLKTQLDQLALQYTEKHPDITAIKQTIAQLEEKRKEELAAAAKAQAASPASISPSNVNESPVYAELKMTLAQAEADVAALTTRVEEYRNRVNQFNKLVDTVPEIEAELKRLDRDYALNKEQYTELLKRRESARLSQEVDQKADDIKVKVIDPPRIPITPIGPNRIRFLSLVFFAALAVGGGIAFLLAQINPRFHATDELKEFTRLPVLGAVSMVSSRRQRTERRMELAVFGLVLLGLFAVFGGLMSLEALQFDLHSHLTKLIGIS